MARIPAAPADGYGYRSGDASEESGARVGELRQCAPLPPGSELVESPHEVSVLELARRDTGALMGLLVLVLLVLLAPGCAEVHTVAETPPGPRTWIDVAYVAVVMVGILGVVAVLCRSKDGDAEDES